LEGGRQKSKWGGASEKNHEHKNKKRLTRGRTGWDKGRSGSTGRGP